MTARLMGQSDVQQMGEQIRLEHQNVMITMQRESGLHGARLLPWNARNNTMNDTSVMQYGQRVGKVNGWWIIALAQRLVAVWLHHGRLVQIIVADEKHARFVRHDNQVERRIVNSQRNCVVFVRGLRGGCRQFWQVQWNIEL